MLLQRMRLARAAGATHATVACLGASGHPQARGLYYSSGAGSSRETRHSSIRNAGADSLVETYDQRLWTG
ncbi:hypothetical protein ABZT45_44410 [Streptomyces sp. NPDC005356]|uniref:hypothetical protein n=1 Tax=Streptomyces sp. NPDC005356 TaxID=3157167 RepID=UPI0033BA8844